MAPPITITQPGGWTGAPIDSAAAHPTTTTASGARCSRLRPARSAAIAVVPPVSNATAPTTVGTAGLGHSVVRSWRGPCTRASVTSPTAPPANTTADVTPASTATTATNTLATTG